jgi:AmmeMemoRadiSam system protein B
MTTSADTSVAPARRPAVAGSFYPADPDELIGLIDDLLAGARPPDVGQADAPTALAGILVPHAGLVFSGPVAAVAWRLVARVLGGADTTVVMLGTNHAAWWLDGVAVWNAGAWRTPIGDVEVDEELAARIAGLGAPFAVDRDTHRAEHSLEVQLPFVARALPGARIVPLSIGAGRGGLAREAGQRLGTLIAERRRGGSSVSLAISTDMAHYPPAAVGTRITEALAPSILALDPAQLARREGEVTTSGLPGVACGMCGIEPTVLGLAALQAMGVERGIQLAATTSADAGGPPSRTVSYLAVAFPG